MSSVVQILNKAKLGASLYKTSRCCYFLNWLAYSSLKHVYLIVGDGYIVGTGVLSKISDSFYQYKVLSVSLRVTGANHRS